VQSIFQLQFHFSLCFQGNYPSPQRITNCPEAGAPLPPQITYVNPYPLRNCGYFRDPSSMLHIIDQSPGAEFLLTEKGEPAGSPLVHNYWLG
jgi:hypothetical protein